MHGRTGHAVLSIERVDDWQVFLKHTTFQLQGWEMHNLSLIFGRPGLLQITIVCHRLICVCGSFLACRDYGGRFNESFPTCTFFFFCKEEFRSHALIFHSDQGLVYINNNVIVPCAYWMHRSGECIYFCWPVQEQQKCLDYNWNLILLVFCLVIDSNGKLLCRQNVHMHASFPFIFFFSFFFRGWLQLWSVDWEMRNKAEWRKTG